MVRFVPGTTILAGRVPRATPAAVNSGGDSAHAAAMPRSVIASGRHKVISDLIRRRFRPKGNPTGPQERAYDSRHGGLSRIWWRGWWPLRAKHDTPYHA